MNIEVQHRPFTLELATPIETASGSIAERSGFLLRVEHDSRVGFGEATPLAGWTESYDDCRNALEALNPAASIAVSEDGFELDPALDRTPALRHGLELALLDLQATDCEIPLYQLLDHEQRKQSIPTHATIGSDSVEPTVQAIDEAVNSGYETVKLKVGNRPFDVELRRIRSVIETFQHDDVRFRLDANGSWSLAEALCVSTEIPSNETTLEQPLEPKRLTNLDDIRSNGVFIAIDEGLYEHGVDRICRVSAIDFVVIKPMAIGGIWRSYEIATWFRERGIEPIVSTLIDGTVARTAAVHLAAAIPDVAPAGVATGNYFITDLADDPVEISNGRAILPQRVGIGTTELWSK